MHKDLSRGRQDPRIGSLLSQTYRLDRVIGIGGMGVVYAGEHVHLQRRVAVKVLHKDVAELKVALERFRREAQIASRLGHAGLVEVLDFNFTDDGAPYMVMELLDGETLAERLLKGPLGLPETCALFEKLCDALHVVHEAGVVHRDLKPDNIFLLDTLVDAPRVKILDFGISKIQHLRNASKYGELTGHDVLGTPCYLAPEQAVGAAREVDRRADIFSLGTILYECLTGQRAFDGPHAVAILQMMMTQPMPRASERLPDMPASIDEVIGRACRRDPAERFATAREMYEALLRASGALADPTNRTAPPGAAGMEWGDGDTLHDAGVADLKEAARSMLATPVAGAGTGRTRALPDAPAPVPDARFYPPLDAGSAAPRTSSSDLTAVTATMAEPPSANEPAPMAPRKTERPTALLDAVPTPPEGMRPPLRWGGGQDATIDLQMGRRAPPAPDARGLGVTLTAALLAVLLGVVVGMLVLKLSARDQTPSLALEQTQKTQEILEEGERLAAEGRCDEALRRASSVLIADAQNRRARRILLLCQRR